MLVDRFNHLRRFFHFEFVRRNVLYHTVCNKLFAHISKLCEHLFLVGDVEHLAHENQLVSEILLRRGNLRLILRYFVRRCDNSLCIWLRNGLLWLIIRLLGLFLCITPLKNRLVATGVFHPEKGNVAFSVILNIRNGEVIVASPFAVEAFLNLAFIGRNPDKRGRIQFSTNAPVKASSLETVGRKTFLFFGVALRSGIFLGNPLFLFWFFLIL